MKRVLKFIEILQEKKKIAKIEVYFAIFAILLFLFLALTLPNYLVKHQQIYRSLAQVLTGQTVMISSPIVVAPGGTITTTISNNTNCTTSDRVGLFAVANPNDDVSMIAWNYLNGSHTAPSTCQASASLNFTAPTNPGNYELRFFRNNNFDLLAKSLLIGVPPAVSLVTDNTSWPTPQAKTVNTLCGEPYANGSNNWISFATYSPVTDGSADISPKLITAIQDAINANKCL